MWSCSRRVFILGAGLAGALAGCGFTPVYGPDGSGNRLLGQVALTAPETPNDYTFNRRFEDRMGRVSGAPYLLVTQIRTDRQDFGTTSTGSITRKRLTGTVTYSLRDSGGAMVASGKTDAFTGYSTTGSTVATLAAERDAGERLMVILADQVIDLLLLQAPDLPPDPQR